MDRHRMIDPVKLVLSIIICQLAGFIGSLFTRPAIPMWYAILNRPSFTPPSSLFTPVWTILFLLMGISLFLIWRRGEPARQIKIAILFFSIQLVLNILWSFLFFGLKSPFAGLIEIVILWIAISLTIVSFYRISKTAALLLVPYILWVSFAIVLNFYFWRLNI